MEVEIGKVTHYYNHLRVAVLSLKDSLGIGDTIHVLGHQTDFTQKVSSMEIEHHSVVRVNPGEAVAVQVAEPVHVHDTIYRVSAQATEALV